MIAGDAEALAVATTLADWFRTVAHPRPTEPGSYGLRGEKRCSTGALFAD
ncbi:hypothetical protein [Streptomyces sp. Ru72]|nr:hypothetical protein [Streptomyces sp. Ru72]